MPPRRPSRKPKSPGPRPVTATYLRNAALHYLSARAAGTAMLIATLERRACRRLGVRSLDAATRAMIDAAVADLVQLGLVDDAIFARQRAASLANKGLSKRRIEAGLRRKGLDRGQIAAAEVGELDDLALARRYAERKRLGHWRATAQTQASRVKDLRALARAGFAYAVARKALVDPS